MSPSMLDHFYSSAASTAGKIGVKCSKGDTSHMYIYIHFFVVIYGYYIYIYIHIYIYICFSSYIDAKKQCNTIKLGGKVFFSWRGVPYIYYI